MIVLFNKTIVKLDEYERSVESDIRKLKTRLALITEARKQKEKKLENIKNFPPERMESSSDTSGGVVHESDKFKFVKIKRIKK